MGGHKVSWADAGVPAGRPPETPEGDKDRLLASLRRLLTAAEARGESGKGDGRYEVSKGTQYSSLCGLLSAVARAALITTSYAHAEIPGDAISPPRSRGIEAPDAGC